MKRRQKLRKGLILASFFLFPATFYYFSPVLILQAAADGVLNGSGMVFLALFSSSLLLGRAYCGWLCPAAGCQEALFQARYSRVTRGDILKWLLWVPWVGTIGFLALRAGGYRQTDFLYQTSHGLSIGDVQGLITYLTVLLGLIVLPGLLVGRRSFCHHLCWMAPFMILGRAVGNAVRWPALALAADPDRCVHCHSCVEHCPMSLPVETMVATGTLEQAECILCGTCVDACDCQVLALRFRRRGRPAAPAEGKR